MKKLIVASSVLATSAAFAGDYKINLESRADLIMNTSKTTTQAGVATETKENSFKNNAIRLNLVGTVNESLTYRFRYRFTKNETDVARDGSSNMLDFIYVDHKNSFFTTRIGKQSWSEAYGRESFVATTDLLIPSLVKTNYGTAIGEYRYGVTAMMKLAETYNFALAVSNPNTDLTATTGAKKNTAIGYNATFNTSLLNKMLQPSLAYTLAPQDGDTEAAAATRTKKGNHTLLAVGLRSEVAGFVIDADYKTLTKANRNDGTNTTTHLKETSKSMYFNVAYALNEFTPFVTYVNDKYTKENTAASDYKKNQIAAGVMYKPFADVNFRYHLVYATSTQKYDSSTATNKEVKDNNIILGIKADI